MRNCGSYHERSSDDNGESGERSGKVGSWKDHGVIMESLADGPSFASLLGPFIFSFIFWAFFFMSPPFLLLFSKILHLIKYLQNKQILE